MLSGKVAPRTENPVPPMAASLTVTGAVPVELSVIDCVAGVFTATLPNDTLAALTPSVGVPGPTSNAKLAELSPDFAVKVTVSDVLDAVTVALKLAEFAPAATVNEEGTVTAELLLERLTVNPPVPAATFRLTVQGSVPDTAIDPLAHVSPPMVDAPVPDRLTFRARPSEEVFVNVNSPVDVPAAVGSNCTLRLAV